MCHPYSLQSRHRKFGACFYLPSTIAVLCFPKLQLLLRGNGYRGRMYQSGLNVEDHNLSYRRRNCIIGAVCPTPTSEQLHKTVCVNPLPKVGDMEIDSLTRVPLVGKLRYCVRELVHFCLASHKRVF